MELRPGQFLFNQETTIPELRGLEEIDGVCRAADVGLVDMGVPGQGRPTLERRPEEMLFPPGSSGRPWRFDSCFEGGV